MALLDGLRAGICSLHWPAWRWAAQSRTVPGGGMGEVGREELSALPWWVSVTQGLKFKLFLGVLHQCRSCAGFPAAAPAQL